ncbi:mannose-6-phosphate isomerase isoform X1 [Eucyclogobius newberryi]|uniref:mannose-6-phosphate isomerase isoform X1 n=1 Tax=Eucyclogobius newberryi TaxID=166745 RepID=UPI003B5AEE79
MRECTAMAEVKVLPLACRAQLYSWGKLGLNSEVAQLLLHSATQSNIDPDTPYAELWMGAHPKADSGILLDRIPDQTLGSWIQKNPQSLGSKVRERFNGKLPFLFKVLSVRTALSIQAHPDLDLAVRLHAQFPEHYPDDNHKPEMAIALTPFTGLCGFRPVSEILDFLSEVPELLALVGPDSVQALKSGLSDLDQTGSALKFCFSSMMRSRPDLVQTQLQALVHRASEGKVPLDSLLLKLHSQFPGDIGCFCIYFLNLVELQPGDAMFLRANEIHAYLYGDCIECMACSDNTVRAGLTPKFLDVETLCEMLDYSPSPAQSKLFPCRRDDQDDHVTLYDPPIDDFSVIRIQVPLEVKCYTVSALDSGSILLVVSGSAHCPEHDDITLRRGSVFFLSANHSLRLEVTSSIELYRACCLL